MNCKYITTKLIKKINECYFKEYQGVLDGKWFPVGKDHNVSFLYADLINVYKNNSVDDEFFNMVYDLNDEYDGTYKSELGQELYQTIKDLSGKINLDNLTLIGKIVASTLMYASNNSYIVGGFVRDTLLGNKSKDVDFVTDTPMAVINDIFTTLGFNTKDVGEQFLVTIVEKDGEMFEIANFRKDKGNEGGELGDIFTDGERRDFTINALYFNIGTFRIEDPNGTGIDAVLNKELKFVGNAVHRLKEDPIRAMRFYRFITKGLTPDKKSLQAVRARMQNDYKKTVDLQKVLRLPGVKEIVEADNVKKHSPKAMKMNTIDNTFNELQETLLSFERMRLEIERIVGL